MPCPSLYRTEQFLRGEEGSKRCREKARKRGDQQRGQKGKKDVKTSQKTTEEGALHEVFVRDIPRPGSGDIPTCGSLMSQEHPAPNFIFRLPFSVLIYLPRLECKSRVVRRWEWAMLQGSVLSRCLPRNEAHFFWGPQKWGLPVWAYMLVLRRNSSWGHPCRPLL